MPELKVLTWHVHGKYLYYLSQIPHTIYLPVNKKKSGDYMGKGDGFPWPENVIEIPVDEVHNLELDCILFQRNTHYYSEQYKILSHRQRNLPKIYLEHDPPQQHPTNTRHYVDDPQILLVHVTDFNSLMWDSGRTPTQVIKHGVIVPDDASYTGQLEKGLVFVNNILSRDRRLGVDVFETVRQQVPLDLIGMNSEDANGLGEIPHERLSYFEAQYRFFFNPTRYTSLSLAVCEAMMLGIPVIGLATTEMVGTVHNGVSGYVDTNINYLILRMEELLEHPYRAYRLGAGAQRYAREHFHIKRFVKDWHETLTFVTGKSAKPYVSLVSK